MKTITTAVVGVKTQLGLATPEEVKQHVTIDYIPAILILKLALAILTTTCNICFISKVPGSCNNGTLLYNIYADYLVSTGIY